MSLLVKICGLSTEESVDCAVKAGADMLGLNFHPKSPRYVTPERAAMLAMRARGQSAIVALAVDPDDAMLSGLLSTVSPDIWQFHGQESYERIRDTRSVFGLPIMKALGISEAHDLQAARNFAPLADYLLLDAKPPKDAAYPGGHGRPFDWGVLSTLPPALPFMLSGGLSPENVGEAIRTIRAMGLSLSGVDVSSGVESAPGVKDLGKIRAFIAAAREADRSSE
jgi:phosphoribosylanthranilate isomerase